MRNTTNIPYVKKYDANGRLINPIKGVYSSNGPNRRQRRMYLQKSSRL